MATRASRGVPSTMTSRVYRLPCRLWLISRATRVDCVASTLQSYGEWAYHARRRTSSSCRWRGRSTCSSGCRTTTCPSPPARITQSHRADDATAPPDRPAHAAVPRPWSAARRGTRTRTRFAGTGARTAPPCLCRARRQSAAVTAFDRCSGTPAVPPRSSAGSGPRSPFL